MDTPYVVVPALIVLVCLGIFWFCLRSGIQLWKKRQSLWRTLLAATSLIFLGVFTLSLSALTGFNAVALYHVRHPAPGQLYRVDGREMRMACTGSGAPTLILEAGGGETGLMWSAVQPSLSQITRVCSYDRSGMGWSDTSPSVRDADSIAQELHALLQTAHIEGPLVLVGASRGGLYIRDFASKFPEQVAGLVLVDSSTPLQQDDPTYKAFDSPRRVSKWVVLMNQAVFIVGIPRLMGACDIPFASTTEQAARLRSASECHQSFDTDTREQEALDASGKETLHTAFGSRPVLVVSHDPTAELREDIPPALEATSDRWQQEMMKLSSCGHRVIVRGSGHRISDTRPRVLTKDVGALVAKLKEGALDDNYCGVTEQH
jgi:pimeloyl-ACP methyl ester carboxylesterase